jgi:hypothetical protein
MSPIFPHGERPADAMRPPQIGPVVFTRAPATNDDVAALMRERRRRRIWEIDGNLHCSIIGTCLSTAELRQLLTRLALDGAATANDHDLHGHGVRLAKNRDAAARLLNKALDRRHALAITRFAKAKSEGELSAAWAEALKRGDIPGAYWAVLTHPETGDALRRKVFGEVHMLSHLVGAANRADIRRLHQLEQENAHLLAKVDRQQAQLREALVARDENIRALSAALSERIESEDRNRAAEATPKQEAALTTVIAMLERNLTAERARRDRAERQAQSSGAGRAEVETALRRTAEERDALRAELATAEEKLGALLDDRGESSPLDLTGLSLLYVGGRLPQVHHLRALSERASARFLHHDGGVEERSDLLPGLVSRADIALFPVDCVSHEAALLVKRLCRQSGKPWVPLRSASVTAFLAAVAPLRDASRRRATRAEPI